MKRLGALSLLVLAGLIALALLLGWVRAVWQAPLTVVDTSPPGDVRLEVRAGDSLGAVLNRVAESGWLKHPVLVGYVARVLDLDQQLHVGEYALNPGETAASLIQRLNRGDVIRYRVTLPEGITLARAIELLGDEEALTVELSGPNDPRLLALAAPHPSAEGWFLPDTYQFARGDTDLAILRRAHTAMRDLLEREWPGRDPELVLQSPYEALILASIIERETGVPEERPQIAGVFHRRLLAGMRLQTDPTIIYGLGSRYSGNLTRRHLRDAGNPYNTYQIDGLPPTPIALPGSDAVRAALHPAPGNTLYFVARGDGSHAFATTLDEHEDNVRSFQLKRRADYRSSPQ